MFKGGGMNWSLGLMALATVFWCQNMEERSLWVYALAVLTTAIGKTVWGKL